jgi:hypothetical protein
MKATLYTVETRSGQKHKCQIVEQSKFGRVMSWGMAAAGSGANCTAFGSAKNAKGMKKPGTATDGAPPRPAAQSPSTGTLAIDDKTLRKISLAIGEEVGEFRVSAREEIESTAGMEAMLYTVNVDGGRKYKCQIVEQSKFGRVMSWGMAAGGSGAECTDFTEGSRDKGKVNQASCHGLMRAAGKCG